MIHKIKAMYDEGRGSSIRAIAQELRLSRNTVRRYLRMDEGEIQAYQARKGRSKRLDAHRSYIIHLLEAYPRLSAVKVLRKLKAAHGDLSVSDRTVRRYIRALKAEVTLKQQRYYEPVLDMVPGVQCQVDGGELRGVEIGSQETTVYFVVFVLSWSRLMYVAASPNPIDTETLIRMHDAAFRAFGGCPKECVYDQTRLVVLAEEFRELKLNPRFHQYATTAGFTIRACEGYDPESKGKVEAGVKYVKDNGLYGERFEDWAALESYLAEWLDTVANERTHASTGQVPRERFEQGERDHLQPYLTPTGLLELERLPSRQVDKTGLIAWKANKYSVPLAYQNNRVEVREEAGELHIHEPGSGQVIARHLLAVGKGQVIKNTHHYRDRAQQIEQLEQQIAGLLEPELAQRLCRRLREQHPKIYKDQLRGVCQVLKAQDTIDPDLIAALCDKPKLSATMLRDYLAAYQCHPQRRQETKDRESCPHGTNESPLACYGRLGAEEVKS